MKDLFGQEITPPDQVPKHGHKRTFYIRRYRRSDNKLQCCKTCRHMRLKDSYSRNFYKCALIGDSNAPTTDIRLRNVCDLWDMEVKTLDEFKAWYEAKFCDDQEYKKKILKKVKELYENVKTTSGTPA